jgi:hypothetical protein
VDEEGADYHPESGEKPGESEIRGQKDLDRAKVAKDKIARARWRR